MLNKKALAASVSAPPAEYVEDVFSTYLYTGNGTTGQTIANNIDLAGDGGMVWIKGRESSADENAIFDTARGDDSVLSSQNDDIARTETGFGSFLSNGFSLVSGGGWYNINQTRNYCSWTFRKAKKFFDVVTYTGNGSNRTISHNLGSVPGMIIVKRTDTTGAWQVYHRSLANTEYLVLNTTAAKATGTDRWNSTTPTSTEFNLGTDATVNANTGTYVAYLFAHDAGGFGAAGTDNIISCGSMVTSTPLVNVNLGYEPQLVMWKRTDATGNWGIADNMRGMPVSGNDQVLIPNLSNAESLATRVAPNATGFTFDGGVADGSTFIYMAIRRPMKTPTSGTEVFSPIATTPNANNFAVTTSNLVDMIWSKAITSSGGDNESYAFDRLRGSRTTSQPFLKLDSTGAEVTQASQGMGIAQNTGYIDNWFYWNYGGGRTIANWAFTRAPGFFDVVCYTGTGSATTVTHNLGVVPELIIVKSRSNALPWNVYCAPLGSDKRLRVNTTDASQNSSDWNSTTPTSSVFSVGSFTGTNGSGQTHVAYLFATVDGVSKVGSYTGNGSNQTINCGFTAGARFVLIKRTDSTGDWYIWDTARGIVSGNDPYLLLNTQSAEVTNTDYIDPANSGFEISSTAPAAINANGGSFIFMAIA